MSFTLNGTWNTLKFLLSFSQSILFLLCLIPLRQRVGLSSFPLFFSISQIRDFLRHLISSPSSAITKFIRPTRTLTFLKHEETSRESSVLNYLHLCLFLCLLFSPFLLCLQNSPLHLTLSYIYLSIPFPLWDWIRSRRSGVGTSSNSVTKCPWKKRK